MPDQLDQPLPDSRLRWLRRTHPAHASRSDGFGRFAEATAAAYEETIQDFQEERSRADR